MTTRAQPAVTAVLLMLALTAPGFSWPQGAPAPSPSPVPVYLDWQFWSAIAAWAALAITLWPILRRRFTPGVLEVEAYDSAVLTHDVGLPRVQMYLILRNTGGRELRVRSITLEVERDGVVTPIRANGYYQQFNDTNAVLFSPFDLKAKEEWVHSVYFSLRRTREDDRKLRESALKIQDDIFRQRDLPENKESKIAVAASGQLWRPFVTFCDAKFIWRAAEYQLRLKFEIDPPNASVTKRYRFTVFETDERELLEIREHYKLGKGVYWGFDKMPAAVVTLSEQ